MKEEKKRELAVCSGVENVKIHSSEDIITLVVITTKVVISIFLKIESDSGKY